MAYGTDQGLTDFLLLTGRTLPVGMTPAVARQWGSAYVNLFERKFKGTSIALPDSFPRDIYDPTPVAIEYAAYEAAFAYASGTDIFGGGGTAGGQVTEESVDVLRVKYAAPESGTGFWENNLYILPLAYSYLQPYFKTKYGTGAAFVVGRIGCGC